MKSNILSFILGALLIVLLGASSQQENVPAIPKEVKVLSIKPIADHEKKVGDLIYKYTAEGWITKAVAAGGEGGTVRVFIVMEKY